MHFRRLSIPFAWDFSMHRFFVFCGWWGGGVFQFPLLGIFPCIAFLFFVVGGVVVSFNSLCLGFFHASSQDDNFKTSLMYTFNSLCLGFFHASYWNISIRKVGSVLSIPFAWDFSMHLKHCNLCEHVFFELSIPFAWDFSMHHN